MVLDSFFAESNIFGENDYGVNDAYMEALEPIAIGENEHPVDACFRLTLENEKNWYNIFNTIAVSEMSYMEKHGTTDVMYEAIDVKKIGSTIATWVEKAWQKLKGVFLAAIDKITMAMKTDKKLLDAYGKVSKNINVDSYEVKSTIWATKSVQPDSIVAKINAESNSKLGRYKDANTGMSKEKIAELKKDWADKKTDLMEEIRGGIVSTCGGKSDNLTADAFPAKLSKAITGSDETNKVSIKTAYETLKSGTTVKDVRKAFKDAEKVFQGHIKMAKAIKAEADKKSDNYNTAVDLSQLKSEAIRNQISLLNVASAVVIRVVAGNHSTMRAVLNRAIKSAGKPAEEKDKKAVGESTEVEDIICSII
ncbi:MAG: hypothetical protein PHC62_00690 [Candidatus Izemoplasmatales bacterium]|nr:hypothetical protein [Candidatus Izemoplasmatales bacterium]